MRSLIDIARVSRRSLFLRRMFTTSRGQPLTQVPNIPEGKLSTNGLNLNAKPFPPGIKESILKHYNIIGVGDSWVTTSPEYLHLWSRLGISGPWYCDDTGHMNAVELNLIFNQMMYLAIYQSIRLSRVQQLNDFPLERYMDKAWPDFLIVNICSAFRKPILVNKFSGVLRVGPPRVSRSENHLLFNLKLNVHQNLTQFPDPGGADADAVSDMSLAIKNFRDYPDEIAFSSPT